MDHNQPGSSVHVILLARILEWVAMPFPRGSFWPGIELTSLKSPALADGFFTINATWEAQLCYNADYILLFTYIWFKFLLFLLD